MKVKREGDLSNETGLGEGPVGNVAVCGDTVEGERAQPSALPGRPTDGRHRIRVLAPGRARFVERPRTRLAHIQHKHATVVQPHCQQVGVLRMEVQAHHPCRKCSKLL